MKSIKITQEKPLKIVSMHFLSVCRTSLEWKRHWKFGMVYTRQCESNREKCVQDKRILLLLFLHIHVSHIFELDRRPLWLGRNQQWIPVKITISGEKERRKKKWKRDPQQHCIISRCRRYAHFNHKRMWWCTCSICFVVVSIQTKIIAKHKLFYQFHSFFLSLLFWGHLLFYFFSRCVKIDNAQKKVIERTEMWRAMREKREEKIKKTAR